jgi:hypothetical protein
VIREAIAQGQAVDADNSVVNTQAEQTSLPPFVNDQNDEAIIGPDCCEAKPTFTEASLFKCAVLHP